MFSIGLRPSRMESELQGREWGRDIQLRHVFSVLNSACLCFPVLAIRKHPSVSARFQGKAGGNRCQGVETRSYGLEWRKLRFEQAAVSPGCQMREMVRLRQSLSMECLQ